MQIISRRDRRRSHLRRAVAVTLLAALAMGGAAVLAPPADAAPPCGTVVRASVTVTTNLLNCPGDGLVVGANGITINLGGRTIDGTGLGSGIRNNGFDDVTIVGPGTITEFDVGVALNPGTLRNIVRNTTITLNEFAGVQLTNADTTNQILSNRINSQSSDGVALLAGSTGNVVRGNTVTVNQGTGIVLDAANTTTVETNQVLDSGDGGITLTNSDGNVLLTNTVRRTGDVGIRIEAGSDTNRAQGNTVTDIGDAGIAVIGGTGNRLLSNTSQRNSDSGIALQDTVNAEVRGNDVRFNPGGVEAIGIRGGIITGTTAVDVTGIGISVENGSGTQLTSNTASSNDADGIHVAGTLSPGLQIRSNTASSNSADGIQIAGTGNTVASNIARNNSGWGLIVAPGNTNGGGNRASGNGEAAQCLGIPCAP